MTKSIDLEKLAEKAVEEPIVPAVKDRLPTWEDVQDYMRSIGSSKFNDPAVRLAYEYICANMRPAEVKSANADAAKRVQELERIARILLSLCGELMGTSTVSQ